MRAHSGTMGQCAWRAQARKHGRELIARTWFEMAVSAEQQEEHARILLAHGWPREARGLLDCGQLEGSWPWGTGK